MHTKSAKGAKYSAWGNAPGKRQERKQGLKARSIELNSIGSLSPYFSFTILYLIIV
jgi:hypothetical protein